MQKSLAGNLVSGYSLGMEILPFPADSAEYAEYVSVMEAMADEADAAVRDAEPADFDYSDEERELDEEAYWAKEPEDRYLDQMYEDRYEISEYGMDGCCGDF